ncbi:MAG TPA: hypothetical protein VFW64_17785 [Pseudonocardiaceae bacterium]|nr:hypothetical protein [Pseudonocardiaceae bacterium]
MRWHIFRNSDHDVVTNRRAVLRVLRSGSLGFVYDTSLNTLRLI